MLRRIMPWLMVFVSAMLDTTILPMLYRGPYAISVTWIAVMCIALLTGRMPGMLMGLFGGVILDVSAGSLGERMIALIAIGYLLGLIVYESDPRRLREITRRTMHLRRLGYSTAFTLAAEGVVCFYQYFNTAHFEMIYVLNCTIRAVLTGAATVFVLPAAARLLFGKRNKGKKQDRHREVKAF